MFPAPTSLIPVQVALARFLESQGLLAALGNYPYWYLGTTPFRFLTGPILPTVLVFLHRLFPNLSLFQLIFILMIIFWLVGAFGVFFLVKVMSNGEGQKPTSAFLAAFFYLFGLVIPFLFRFSDGLMMIAFAFIPYALIVYFLFLKKWSRGLFIILTLLISLIILLDSLMVNTLILGMIAVLLAATGWKRIEEKLKQTILVLFLAFLIATFWYTPGYWWTLLGAPSFGGKGLAQVIVLMGKLLPVAIALTFAVFSVKFFKKREILRDFCFYFLFIFGFLTLIRFLSDPDFWLDWTAYGMELQLGIAIALGGWLGGKLEDRRQKTEDGLQKTEDGRQIIKNQSSVFSLQNLFSVFRFPSSMLLALYLILFTFIFNKYVLGTLQRDITGTVEHKIGSQLSMIAKGDERVFLSGTSAFWLNAFFDIPQVRGGRDQASVDPDWRAAAWEIREGPSTNSGLIATEKWLRTLNVSYLVVHAQDSEEFYHDFTSPEKFEKIENLVKVYEERGDRIYFFGMSSE